MPLFRCAVILDVIQASSAAASGTGDAIVIGPTGDVRGKPLGIPARSISF